MEKKEFAEKVAERLRDSLGEGYNVRVEEVPKINCVRMGVVISGEGEVFCPTIYLDEFFGRFSEGYTLNSIVQDVMEIFEDNHNPMALDMEAASILDFDRVKEKIVTKVICADRNKQLLATAPHIMLEELGLAAVFYVVLQNGNGFNSGYMIKNEHIRLWNTTAEQLLETARENMKEHYSLEVLRMKDILADVVPGFFEEAEHDSGMYVLTDLPTKTLGASSLIFTDKIREFSQKSGCDLYILPSSIHELILLRADKGDLKTSELREMVREVNRTQVRREEFLSDDVFFYLQGQDRIIRL